MSNFAPILQLIPSSETPVGGNDVYITHQDTSNNEPMVNQLFENAISQGYNELSSNVDITSTFNNNINIIQSVNQILGTGYAPGDTITDYALGLILVNGAGGTSWQRDQPNDYSAEELLYWRVRWSKLDYSEDDGVTTTTPPFKTYIDGIDINTYVGNAMNYVNANVTTSASPVVNLFLIRSRPLWPTYAPYTDGIVLQEINNWITSNDNATAKNLGTGTTYPTQLFHRSGITPAIPDNNISLFILHVDSNGSGTGDPVVTATGAALQFTPKFNINDLIA